VRRLALFALALALAPVALAGGSADPGVTTKEILLGGTVPTTGVAALFGSVGPGADAYFKYVNAHGGVNGRKIRYEYLDDQYDVTQTVQQTRKLVEQDHVFALFNSVGTPNVEAVRGYQNAAKVPQLFAGTGIAIDRKSSPWTMGYLPSFKAEGRIYGRLIRTTMPKAKVGVLYENTDFGKELTTGLKLGLGAQQQAMQVGEQSYEVTDTSVAAQMAALQSSGANTVALFATPQYAIYAYVAAYKLGWHPQFFLSSVSPSPNIMAIARLNSGTTTNGTITAAFVKDPTHPRWAKDPAVKLYKQILKRYLPGKRADDVYLYYGMATAYTMVDALKHAGTPPTRAGLLRAATHLNEVNPFLFPGIKVQTSPTNYYPLRQAYLVKFKNGRWDQFGSLVPAAE
jgi:branched-chain amino acid transport system substrate-binding protein